MHNSDDHTYIDIRKRNEMYLVLCRLLYVAQVYILEYQVRRVIILLVKNNVMTAVRIIRLYF